jgi:hypothetical protein
VKMSCCNSLLGLHLVVTVSQCAYWDGAGVAVDGAWVWVVVIWASMQCTSQLQMPATVQQRTVVSGVGLPMSVRQGRYANSVVCIMVASYLDVVCEILQGVTALHSNSCSSCHGR